MGFPTLGTGAEDLPTSSPKEMTIRLPALERPKVSIVIVAYGGWPLLSSCLTSIRDHTDSAYEVVIVDNASPDETSERLRSDVDGAKLIFKEENIGFGPGSNEGASAARAPRLCFLNGDALVQPGWLPPLLEVLDADEEVGAVVPLLLNEDGTVQEAGSVVDSEGWALALGGGDPPQGLEHRFGRDVDFGSAACLLISKETFERVGGFDPAYAIGYYEDVDLCFKLAELGLRTRFEPRSRVVHVRFGSGSPSAAQARVQENRIAFVNRWHERLDARPRLIDLPSHQHRVIAARDAEAYERILVVDDRVPHVDRGSGDPRMAKLLLEAATLWPRGRITLLATSSGGADDYATPLLDAGVEVVAPPLDWEEWFDTRAFHYSAVIVSRSSNTDRLREVLARTQPQALRIFDAEALTSRRLHLQAAVADDEERARALRALALDATKAELRAIDEADLVFVVSEEERAFVRGVDRDKPTLLLPSCVDAQESPPGFEDRRYVIFFGGFLAGGGSPNEDALLHLVREIMPIVWDAEPDVILHVIGADPTDTVLKLHGGRINVVGYVPDPNEWLSRARVHIHPMRFGAGIKLKLIETMAAGLPFVSSRVGAEGLGLGPLGALLVNDEPDEIARRTLLLYRDAELWWKTQLELLGIARERFSRAIFRRTLAEAMISAGMEPPRELVAQSA
jgi:GT2 family glycosyltransferase